MIRTPAACQSHARFPKLFEKSILTIRTIRSKAEDCTRNTHTASAKVMETLVFGVSASDPLTLAAVAATLALVALMASLVPAYRALRLDPVKVLRAD